MSSLLNVIIARPIENGMSSYEVLQHEIIRLSEAAQKKYAEHEEIMARIERLKVRLDNWNVSRRERWTMEDEIELLRTKADRLIRDYIRLSDECRGMKKAVDLIIYVHNNGGEVTERNRRGVEALMNV